MGFLLNLIITFLLIYLGGKLLVFLLRWYLVYKLQKAGAGFASDMFNQANKAQQQKRNTKANKDNNHYQSDYSTKASNDSEAMLECSKCSTFTVSSQMVTIDGHKVCNKCAGKN